MSVCRSPLGYCYLDALLTYFLSHIGDLLRMHDFQIQGSLGRARNLHPDPDSTFFFSYDCCKTLAAI
jgi:hypothetical protein